MKRLFFITTLLTLPYSAIAEKHKAFACISSMDTDKTSSITLIKGTREMPSAVYVNENRGLPAYFELNGPVHQWYLGCDVNTRECDYTFRLKANGFGYLHDLSNNGKSMPSMKFTCRSIAMPETIYRDLTEQ